MSKPRALSGVHRQWLLGELDVWQDAGLVSKTDAARILDLYEPAAEEARRQQQWFLTALGAFAALLLFAAAALLVSYNWSAIPAAGKLAIVFSVLLATYGLAAVLWHFGKRRTSEVVLFFGVLFYGASIWLIAQIFHMDAHYPDGYFWWAIGVLPLALIFDTLLLRMLLAILISAWVGTEILDSRWQHWEASNRIYLAPLLLLPGIWSAYKQSSLARLAIALPALVWWAYLLPFAWDVGGAVIYFVALIGATLLIVAESHPPHSKMAIPYRLLGIILYGAVLIPLTYGWFLPWTRIAPATLMILLIFTFGLTLIVLTVGALLRFQAQGTTADSEDELVSNLYQRQWLPVSLATVIGVLVYLRLTAQIDGAGDSHLASMLTANVAMIALAIWLVFIGARENRVLPFIGGGAYFLTWMLLRYFDLFGSQMGMLGAAALFAACGLTIGGLAWFWQRRTEVQHVAT